MESGPDPKNSEANPIHDAPSTMLHYWIDALMWVNWEFLEQHKSCCLLPAKNSAFIATAYKKMFSVVLQIAEALFGKLQVWKCWGLGQPWTGQAGKHGVCPSS